MPPVPSFWAIAHQGTLSYTGSTANLTRGFTINAGGGGISVVTSDQTLTVSGTITGTGPLTKDGAGTLILSVANSYSGDTKISGGTLVLGNANALSGSTLDYNNYGGLLSFDSLTTVAFGGLKGGQSLSLINGQSNAVAFTVGSNGATTTYSGILGGSGTLTKQGAGKLTLSGTNSYSGNYRQPGRIKRRGISHFGRDRCQRSHAIGHRNHRRCD